MVLRSQPLWKRSIIFTARPNKAISHQTAQIVENRQANTNSQLDYKTENAVAVYAVSN
jgi:hypothetical protein